jgi:lipopolysaccharide export system ATP-binding protein
MGGIRQIRFDSICYHTGQVWILHGVYLEVNAGTICGIFGRNGSGKSTLLKIGAGTYRPTSGTVWIDGQTFPSPLKRQRYHKIAYLSQKTFLPHDMTVTRLLNAFPHQARRLVNETPLASCLHQTVGSLSGGECRLLEVLLLIALDRPYVFLDEPFSGLEPVLIDQMSALLAAQRQQGKGIVITDHYYQSVIPLLDTAYFLQHSHCESLEVTPTLAHTLQQRGYVGESFEKTLSVKS